ncbi:MAG: homoserine O-acetyltransferase [Ginsengibacter sp.]
MRKKIFNCDKPLALESGKILPGYHLAYTAYGQLNEAKDNVVWIFHALTANSDPVEWWAGLVGEGKFFNPSKYFIICVNMPGSCYGSIGPFDVESVSNEIYYNNFPWFTIRDMVHAYQPLKEFLGIKKIHIGIGGSMGGQQLLEWAIEEPDAFEYIFPIATNAMHSSWGVAFNATQRMCIEADKTWGQKSVSAGIDGMKAARACALLSYRNYITYSHSQPILSGKNLNFVNGVALQDSARTGAVSYQYYQGEKLAKRFNAYSYYFLSMGMDSHHVGRGRGSIELALQQIKAKTLVIGLDTDILFPLSEQQFLAEKITGATCRVIHSIYGHDGFLLEFDQMEDIIQNFISKEAITSFIAGDAYNQ